MSITVAVNATDGANGPQTAVCQSAAQHNNCGEYNGGVDGANGIDGGGIGIGVNDDDTAVFDHENMERPHEQVRVCSVVCRFGWRDELVEIDSCLVWLATTFADELHMCRDGYWVPMNGYLIGDRASFSFCTIVFIGTPRYNTLLAGNNEMHNP